MSISSAHEFLMFAVPSSYLVFHGFSLSYGVVDGLNPFYF